MAPEGTAWLLYADGAARGNPGPAAYGYVLRDAGGETIDARGAYMGETTNNHAEYMAVIEGLASAKTRGATRVSVQADSELIVRQLTGRYKIKHPRMKELAAQVRELAAAFEDVSYEYIPRAQNAAADALVNEALDAEGYTKKEFIPPWKR